MNPQKPALYKDFTDSLCEILKSKQGSDLEIEVRFGILRDTFTRERLNIDCCHPILINIGSPQLRFIPGVTHSDFESTMNKFIDFKSVNSKDRIVIHKQGRYTFVNGEIAEAIKKTKLKTYDIYNPNSPYDMRLSISREKKIEFVPISERGTIMERLRERTSFKANGLSIDCTVVENEKEKTYEIEVEVVEQNYEIETFLSTVFGIFVN